MDLQLKPGRHGAWQLANARGEPAALRPAPPNARARLVNIPLFIDSMQYARGMQSRIKLHKAGLPTNPTPKVMRSPE